MQPHKISNLKVNTIIISDLHLGSGVSQPEKVLEMLKGYSFQKLILLGDIFDSLDFRGLSKESWELIEYIGKISKHKKVRWVEGNHDAGLAEIFSALLGAEMHSKVYTWQFNQKKYLAIHGHQFDRFLVDNYFISNFVSRIYNFIQKIDYKHVMSRYIKENSKGWLRLSDKVSQAALVYGRDHRADYVFCGHTHKALQKHKNGIKYFNCGCWTDVPCTYVVIDESGVDIREY